MALTGIGDAAQKVRLQRQNRAVSQELGRLTQELASGRKADVAAHLRGNLTGLAGLERSLTLLDTYAEATARGRLHTSVQQEALGNLGDLLTGTATDFLRAEGAGPSAGVAADIVTRGRFDEAVSLLNVRVAGRAAFAGDSPDTTPLADPEAILTALRPIAAGAANAADLRAALEDWFLNPGAGFDAAAYRGGTGPAPTIRVAEGTHVPLGPDARDPALRQALMGLAMGALLGEGGLAAPASEIAAARQAAGEIMLSAQGAVTRSRAELGTVEARIEQAASRNAAMQSRAEIERNRLVSADPYETATRLQAVETQLEGLYVLTARLSRLSLTEYLR